MTGGGTATGGGTGGLMPPAADRCDTVQPLSSGVALTVNPAPYARDYLYGVNSPPSSARDLVFSISVPNGSGVIVDVAPQAALDVAVGETSLNTCPETAQFANVNSTGIHEVLAANNTSGAARVYFFIVYAWGTGTFDVTATVSGTPITCGPTTCGHGCCANNTCRQGDDEVTGCGFGGSTCTACVSSQRCREHVCTTITGTTGGVCTQATDCYSPVVGTRSCSVSWPAGGYCRSTCTVTNSGCGGLSAPGYCTSLGECLVKCNSPGNGRGGCPTGYLCDYSDPTMTTSQGVCVPECGQVACSAWGSGACQPNGLCR